MDDFKDEHTQKQAFGRGSDWSSSPRANENQNGVSVTGFLAVGAAAHVIRVELHLDGDAAEAELGLEQVSGLLQHRLSIGALLWCGTRERRRAA